MKRILFFFSFLLLLSCNDGDLNIPDFSFSNADIDVCGDLVLNKINGKEALIIELNDVNNDSIFIKEGSYNFDLTENGNYTITYRTFDSEPTTDYFCQNIPPVTPKVINEWKGTGTLTITTVFDYQDDNDGVVEDNPNDDSDGDGYINEIDVDDDGDHVLTEVEGTKDTDGDGILDYLDTDDDGDGTPTINESTTDDDDGDTIKNYLDSDSKNSVTTDRSITNSYTIYYRSTFIITNLTLTNDSGNTIQYDVFEDFGNYSGYEVIQE